jgi:hypothetical protein
MEDYRVMWVTAPFRERTCTLEQGVLMLLVAIVANVETVYGIIVDV